MVVGGSRAWRVLARGQLLIEGASEFVVPGRGDVVGVILRPGHDERPNVPALILDRPRRPACSPPVLGCCSGAMSTRGLGCRASR